MPLATTTPTDGRCKVCNGIIFQMEWREYDPATGPIRIGGKGNQHRKRSKLYCGDCGILYHHLPTTPSP
jgi:hypothetical protein